MTKPTPKKLIRSSLAYATISRYLVAAQAELDKNYGRSREAQIEHRVAQVRVATYKAVLKVLEGKLV
jgi:hypothetical protein